MDIVPAVDSLETTERFQGNVVLEDEFQQQLLQILHARLQTSVSPIRCPSRGSLSPDFEISART